MDPRVKRIAERLDGMIVNQHPLAGFVLTFFLRMLEQWKEPRVEDPPAPFGDSPLVDLVESMLPSVEATDQDSGFMIRCLLDKTRLSRDPLERRTLGFALEWFYLYFTKRTELEFESWLDIREKERTH